jgi:hypothetical protein
VSGTFYDPRIRKGVRNLLRSQNVPDTLSGPFLALFSLIPLVAVGCCPFCDFILPAGELLNGLLEHVAAAHPDLRLQGVTLGDIPILTTDLGDFPIRPAERFE